MTQDELLERIDNFIDGSDNEKAKEKRQDKMESLEKLHYIQSTPREEFYTMIKMCLGLMGVLLGIGTIFLMFHMAFWSILSSGLSILVGLFVWAARDIPELEEVRWIDVLDKREMKKMNKMLKECGLKIEETDEHHFLDTKIKRIVEIKSQEK